MSHLIVPWPGPDEPVYTQKDLLAAVEGARTNALDEATNTTCARISRWLMDRSIALRSEEERASEVLEEAALDIRDGEWRRTTPAKPTERT